MSTKPPSGQYYRVRSVDRSGNASAWVTISGEQFRDIPDSPTNVSGSSGAAGELTITWTDSVDNAVNVIIEANGSTDYVGFAAPGIQTYTFTGLASGNYTPRVQMIDEYGNYSYIGAGSSVSVS